MRVSPTPCRAARRRRAWVVSVEVGATQIEAVVLPEVEVHGASDRGGGCVQISGADESEFGEFGVRDARHGAGLAEAAEDAVVVD
jgi:hypothetical protein